MEINYIHFRVNKGGEAERGDGVFVSDCLTETGTEKEKWMGNVYNWLRIIRSWHKQTIWVFNTWSRLADEESIKQINNKKEVNCFSLKNDVN